MRGTSLVASGLTVLVVLSVVAAGGIATGTQDATQITQCTTIDAPGSYELASDLTYTGSGDCVVVAADNVVIDGNDHSIVYDESASDATYSGQGIIVSNQEDVTIRGVAFEDEAMLDVHEATAITVEDNRFNGSAIIDSSTDLVLQDNYFSTANAQLESNENVQIINNRIDDGKIVLDWSSTVSATDNRGNGRLDVEVRNGAAVVDNNSLSAITVGGYDGTTLDVTRNHVTDGGLSVTAHGDASVQNNTVEGSGLTLAGTPGDFLVAHNTITGADVGVEISDVYDGGSSVQLERNVITDSRIGVQTSSNLVELHENDLSGNSEYGVLYTQNDGVVDATQNYWGDRPASVDDENAPFADPETGALADGSGAAVSEGSESGVSNVVFDPWLDTAPDAGVVERSSDGDDSDQTTSTTTATTSTTTATTTATTTSTTATTTPNATTSTTTLTATTTTPTATTDPATTTTATATGADTTTSTDDVPTTTTPTTNDTTTTNSTILTGTTDTDAPGFGHLGALIALLASALLVARRT